MKPPLSKTTVVIPFSNAFFAITVPKYAAASTLFVFSNSALTSGSTYDDTVEAHMKPISKTEHEFKTEQTSDNDAVATTEYGKNLEMEYGREITKTKAGNIGVMPTQNLLELEYYTRLRMTLFDAVVRACCNTLGCGVWED